MNLRTCILATSLAALAGCGVALGGGSTTGTLGGENGTLSAALAPYALLDLPSKVVSYRASAPDLSDPVMRSSTIVFRKVGSGSGAFFIAIFELTQDQWFRLAATSPWTAAPSTVVAASAQAADRPAYNLDFDSLASAVTGFPLSDGAQLALPTAAQWDTAAGVSSGWTWGTTATALQVNAAAVVRESNAGYAGPRQVGSKAASANGLFDVHGNVWEWTTPGIEVRGGSWHDSYASSRVEYRAGSSQGLISDIDHALVGARLVLRP